MRRDAKRYALSDIPDTLFHAQLSEAITTVLRQC
jgi:hypothetical protein